MRHIFLRTMLLGLMSVGCAVAQAENTAPAQRTITVALDGSGDFSSIQEAVDSAGKGDTVLIKAGAYAQDLTVHSKEKIKIVGAGVDKVVLLGRSELVGVLHVGKWPYGATDIEISG
ncbi:MAG: pectinesterase family protein, partial [Nitrospira sp.]